MPQDLTPYLAADGGLFPRTDRGDLEHIVYRPGQPYVILSGAFTAAFLRLIADYMDAQTSEE